jgi:hypothetical protein
MRPAQKLVNIAQGSVSKPTQLELFQSAMLER